MNCSTCRADKSHDDLNPAEGATPDEILFLCAPCFKGWHADNGLPRNAYNRRLGGPVAVFQAAIPAKLNH
tara:strand:- start:1123 stop:1332 length:210 start_codon:yes stop_codon:yes gene_type:complete